MSDGSLISCSAQALVTLVKAKLRFSRFPKEPELNKRAKSASFRERGRGKREREREKIIYISTNNWIIGRGKGFKKAPV